MAKFSTVVIVKNEEKTLPKLLESVKGCDEIIIVDTGSTDKTIEVAKSFGAKVIEKSFNVVIDENLKKRIDEIVGENKINIGDTAFNFGEARNWAADQAKNDIVFMPDADEVVEWDIKEVEKIWDKGIHRLEYRFVFSWDNEGRPLIEFSHSKFYNRKKYRWTRFIHEVILPIKYTNNIEGWMTEDELNFLYELSKQYKTIAEIGSWKGRSTHALLSGCKGEVTAIDHFEGSGEGDLTHGIKTYDEFIKNVGHFKNLKIKKMTGEEASKGDEKYEMVFIDAGHTYEEVKKDIELWQNKATKILCGHDYCDAWEGVKRAVEEKFGKVNHVESIWYVVKEGNVPNVNYDNFYTDKIFLKHYQNYETNRSAYLKGLAIDYIQNPYNDRNCHYFARELYYYGKYKEAIKMFEKHIENPGWDTEKGQSLIFMGNSYRYLGNEQMAMECYARGFVYDMNRREALLAMAQIKYDKKLWVEAERLYWLALMIPKGNYYANWAPNYTHLPWGQLSVCLWYQGKIEKSKECLMKALEYDPNNKVYQANYFFYPKEKTEHDFTQGKNPLIGNNDNLWKATDGEGAEKEVSEFVFGLIKLLKPSVVVETGSYLGNTTLAIAKALKENNFGKLYSCDIDKYCVDSVNANLKKEHLDKFGEVLLTSGVELIKKFGDKIDFAFIDSGRQKEEREDEIKTLIPFLKPMKMFVMHDTAPQQGGFSALSEGIDLPKIYFNCPRGLTLFTKK